MCGNDFLMDRTFRVNSLCRDVRWALAALRYEPEQEFLKELRSKFNGRYIAVFDFGFSTGRETIQFWVELYAADARGILS